MYYFCVWIKEKIEKYLGYVIFWDIWKYVGHLNFVGYLKILGIIEKYLGYIKNICDISKMFGIFKKIFGIFGGKMEEDIGSRLSRYSPDCSEVMVGVGGSVSVKRGRVYQREGGFYLKPDFKILTISIKVSFST